MISKEQISTKCNTNLFTSKLIMLSLNFFFTVYRRMTFVYRTTYIYLTDQVSLCPSTNGERGFVFLAICSLMFLLMCRLLFLLLSTHLPSICRDPSSIVKLRLGKHYFYEFVSKRRWGVVGLLTSCRPHFQTIFDGGSSNICRHMSNTFSVKTLEYSWCKRTLYAHVRQTWLQRPVTTPYKCPLHFIVSIDIWSTNIKPLHIRVEHDITFLAYSSTFQKKKSMNPIMHQTSTEITRVFDIDRCASMAGQWNVHLMTIGDIINNQTSYYSSDDGQTTGPSLVSTIASAMNHSLIETVMISIALLAIIVGTVVGNVLVCIAVCLVRRL